MARRSPMTYRDAVRLLGKGNSGLVDALDQALGLGLLAVTAFSPASALPFFELKNEIISQLNKLVTELKERVRKSRRIEYEQLLVAAHSVIVMAAHAEVLTEQMSDLDGGESLKRELHQWRPQAGSEQIPGKYDRRQFVEWADKSMIRPPGPARPLEDVTADLAKVYQRVSAQAIDYLKGLRCWDELRYSQQEKIEGTFLELWRQAISRYREHLFRLAAQIPEFMIWILLNESNATRALLRTMFASANVESHTVAVAFQDALERLEAITDAQGSALGDLSTVLGEMIDREGDGRRDVSRAIAECHKIHEMVLKKPLLEPRLTGGTGDDPLPDERDRLY
jgi:hypothetical protein